jgi:hypothetical protein
MMKKIAIAAAVMLLGSSGAWAAGTAAGTGIDNTASLTYSVGGVDQTDAAHGGPKDSNNDTFVVDRKIDIHIAVNNSPVSTQPGAQDANLSYRAVNEGNDDETWTFSLQENGGDGFDMDTLSDCHLYNSGTDLGEFGAGNAIDVSIDVDKDANLSVLCDIPAGATDGQDGEIYLVATIKNRPDHSGHADTAGSVAGDAQNVYAEAASDNSDLAHDGHFTRAGTYHISTATLNFVKTSIVISDTSGNAIAHRIPGATIRYCFDINNTGSASAEGVRLHDDFTVNNKDNLTYVKSGIITQVAGSCDCSGNANTSGTSAPATDIYIPDAAAGTTIDAGDQACAYIEATIN